MSVQGRCLDQNRAPGMWDKPGEESRTGSKTTYHKVQVQNMLF